MVTAAQAGGPNGPQSSRSLRYDASSEHDEQRETMNAITDYLLSNKPWISLAAIAVAGFCWSQLEQFVRAHLAKSADEPRAASLRVMLMVGKGAVFAAVALFVFAVNGVDVPGIAASLGVAGIIVGFALQDLLKDLIMGIAIFWDGYYSVGDVVRYGSYEGVVVALNFKSTKLRDIKTGNVVSISNREISQAEVMSDWLDICLPMGYEVPAADARSLGREFAERAGGIADVSAAEFCGTQELGASSVSYLVRLHCAPASRYAVRRKANDLMQDLYAERGVSFPYDRLEVVQV